MSVQDVRDGHTSARLNSLPLISLPPVRAATHRPSGPPAGSVPPSWPERRSRTVAARVPNSGCLIAAAVLALAPAQGVRAQSQALVSQALVRLWCGSRVR